MLTLGLAGSLLGMVLAWGAIAALPFALQSSAPASSATLLAEVHYGVTWSAALQGLGIGALVSLLFSIVPLLQVRFVKPSLLLRDETTRAGVRLDAGGRRGAGLCRPRGADRVAGGVVADRAVGLRRVLRAGRACCMVTGRLLVQAVAPLAHARSFPLRHAVLHLSRPGNQTRVILLAVGLGAFFIVGVRSLQASLLEELSVQVSEDAPDMFLMDIQRDQVDGVRAFLADPANGAGQSRLIPVLRARVTGVSGRETQLESFEDVRARGSLAREYTVTYRDHLESNETIVDGAFWTGPSPEAEVSIERGLHERFQINVGDTVRFDILGRIVNARVSSIREVDWRDSRSGGFMFVFRPGVLDQAPQSYIAPLKGPVDVQARVRFQHDLVERFGNVSVIDFRDILVTIRDVMSKVTLAISVVGGLVLFSGGLILIGAVAMTKFQRVYEAAVFKTLGATTGADRADAAVRIRRARLLAGAVGSLGAVALTWGVSRYALEIPWRIFAGEHVGAVLATAILVAIIGVLSSYDVSAEQAIADSQSGVAARPTRVDSPAFLDRRFALTAHGTTPATEALAGATTFVTMAYIIFVQPAVLAACGMDFGAVLTATCLSTALASILMGLLANYPIAVAPAMGHNFFFAYSVVLGMKVPWPVALGGVAVAGAVFVITAGIRPAREADHGDSGVAQARHRRRHRAADCDGRPCSGPAWSWPLRAPW